jgi:HSP20 family protein
MASRSLFPFLGGSPAERAGGSLDPLLQFRREMDRLFDEVFRYGVPTMTGAGGAMAPRMDIKESEGELKVCVELPGVDQKDVEVTLDGDLLTIRGEKKAEAEDRNENYQIMERSYGSFARSIRLPYAANPDQVQASFENGVLIVTLPKSQAQQRRRIDVKSAVPSESAGGGAAVDRAAAGDKPGVSEAATKEATGAPDAGSFASS